MKQIEVVAAIIYDNEKYFATQRGYGEFDKDAAKQLLESLYGCFLLPYPEPMSRHVPNGRQQCAAGGFVLAAQRELFPLNGHK